MSGKLSSPWLLARVCAECREESGTARDGALVIGCHRQGRGDRGQGRGNRRIESHAGRSSH
ncbi:MAG: hypothetical protein FWH57_10910 [Oscillospiraceae bacterium]|nr:hypothetical protein [Oscillospiraceae bacterium]